MSRKIKAEPETVSEVMSRTVFCLDSNKMIIDALNLMIQKDVGSVPVLENGTLSGIITERDIVRNITTFEKTPFFDYISMPLAQAASKPVIAVEPDLEIWGAFRIMLQKKIRRLPVLKNREMLGIVTERDLFKWVVKVAYEPHVPEEIRNLL
jgi:CBS domain-containing protein